MYPGVAGLHFIAGTESLSDLSYSKKYLYCDGFWSECCWRQLLESKIRPQWVCHYLTFCPNLKKNCKWKLSFPFNHRKDCICWADWWTGEACLKAKIIFVIYNNWCTQPQPSCLAARRFSLPPTGWRPAVSGSYPVCISFPGCPVPVAPVVAGIGSKPVTLIRTSERDVCNSSFCVQSWIYIIKKYWCRQSFLGALNQKLDILSLTLSVLLLFLVK